MNVDSSRLSAVAKMHKRKAHSDCEVFANSKEKLLIFISPKLPALAQTKTRKKNPSRLAICEQHSIE